jgi:hypothetical protein
MLRALKATSRKMTFNTIEFIWKVVSITECLIFEYNLPICRLSAPFEVFPSDADKPGNLVLAVSGSASHLCLQGFAEIHPVLTGEAILAQSPQLAKQICIAADFARVFRSGLSSVVEIRLLTAI